MGLSQLQVSGLNAQKWGSMFFTNAVKTAAG